MTDRTARNYMGAARLAEANPETVSVLPPAVVYKLASPSMTEGARDALLARAAAGGAVGHREVRAALEEDRADREKKRVEQVEQAKLARLTPEARKRSLRTKAERQKQREREQEENRQREEARQAAATAAVALLAERLGADLGRFAELHKAASYEFGAKLADAVKASR
jgi:hypothetical protein